MRRYRASFMAAAIAACGGGGRDPLPGSIRQTLGQELGVAITSVHCGGAACTATTADGLAIPITVTPGEPPTWAAAEVIDPRVLAAEAVEVAATVGLTGPADCGPLRLAAQVDAPIECALPGGAAAFVTVAADGGLAVELAITAEIAAARRGPIDQAALDRASLALDTPDDQADDGDDDLDAGVVHGDAGRPGPGG
ncbi:MAG: hypothetical protein R3B06_32915 [Kofleriaceae bacterium]